MSFLVIFLALQNGAIAQPQPATEPEQKQVEQVSRVLDQLHDAASKADFRRYFDLFVEDAIFLGTDATERWTLDQFKAFAKPHFDQGKGWTYTSTSRHVYLASDGQTAWFDEELINASLGLCRGSGVLVMQKGRWKVAQYNLTIPIPNALAPNIVEQIKNQKKAE